MNYRYSTNLQVAIDANTRLVIALGDSATRQPGNPARSLVLPIAIVLPNLTLSTDHEN